MDSRSTTRGYPWLWVLVLLAVGCSRATSVVPTQAVEAQQFQQRRGGVSVAVDPYFTTDRIVQVFRGGDKFSEGGVLPVQVTIENGTGGAITVNPRDARLLRPGSGPDVPLSPQDAFSLVRIRLQYWALLPVIGSSVTAGRNEPILKDLESRELKEVTIPPGDRGMGFIYFQIPDDQKSLAGSLMVIGMKGPSGQDLIFEIPVDGRRDLPGSGGPSGTAAAPGPPKAVPLDPKVPSSPTRIEGAGGGVIIRSPSR